MNNYMAVNPKLLNKSWQNRLPRDSSLKDWFRMINKKDGLQYVILSESLSEGSLCLVLLRKYDNSKQIRNSNYPMTKITINQNAIFLKH